MAVRRQKLSQRRKAVGLTQESLAERLGVERSTVIRWEAGESQPLPSIRPNLARALHVSIDQLAELLTQSEHAGTAPSADLEVATPVPAPQDQRPGGPELDSGVNPQITETVEALRRALRSAGVSAEDLAAMLLIGGSSTPATMTPATMTPATMTPATIPSDHDDAELRRRRGGSRKRLAAVGLFVLAFPAVWLSAPFVISQSGPSSQAGVGTPQSATPVVAIPAPEHGTDLGRADTAADPASVVPPAGAPAPPAVAAVPVSQTTRAAGAGRTASRSTRSAKRRPPSPRPQEWGLPAAVAGERWDGVSQMEQVGRLW